MDVRFIAGAGVAAVLVVVLTGVFDGEVGRSRVSSQPVITANSQAQVAQIPAIVGRAPGMLGQPHVASQQASPNFLNVAAPMDGFKEPPTPPNFLPSNIQISEAHWQGMDVTVLTAELRQKLRYPSGLLGLLVDEVTLNAARSGLMAGDVIVNVGNVPVTTLEEFQQASRMLRNMNKAELTSLRKGEMNERGRYSMRRVSVALIGDPDLGFAQLESAPMIVPGDGRPHPYRGACTNCHAIGVGFELTPDPDLITLPPPNLTHATVVKGISPHRDRGPCEACHLIVQ